MSEMKSSPSTHLMTDSI